MDLRTEMTYPSATPADVVGLAHDRAYREAVCEATLAVAYDVQITPDDAGPRRVVVRRTIPAAVPDMVKHLVGDTIQIVQTEQWSPPDGFGGYDADLTVQVVGQPATMRGSIRVEANPAGTVQVVQGEIRVTMLFVGKKFESELAKGILAAAEREQVVGREWLARRR
jgi:hypothetical protein